MFAQQHLNEPGQEVVYKSMMGWCVYFGCPSNALSVLWLVWAVASHDGDEEAPALREVKLHNAPIIRCVWPVGAMANRYLHSHLCTLVLYCSNQLPATVL